MAMNLKKASFENRWRIKDFENLATYPCLLKFLNLPPPSPHSQGRLMMVHMEFFKVQIEVAFASIVIARESALVDAAVRLSRRLECRASGRFAKNPARLSLI